MSTLSTLDVGSVSQSGTFYSSGGESTSRISDREEDEEIREMEDFTQEKVISPIDLECQIQIERITKILDEAIYKTKLALCLPKLVQDYKILHSILSAEHMEDLLFIFEEYENPLFSGSLLNLEAMEDLKAGELSVKDRLNPELGHLLYIMNSYPGLHEPVEEMVEKIKEDYYTAQMREANPPLEYLLALERFKRIMLKQMRKTAAEELSEKLRLKKLEESNNRLLEKITEYKETIIDEQEKFDRALKSKEEIITKLEDDLKQMDKTASSNLKQLIINSNKQMVLMSRAHAVKNELLKDEDDEIRKGYNNMMGIHLKEEKDLRVRRFRVEAQLTSWLSKYDTEMTDKQEQLDELVRNHASEVQMCEQLTKLLEEQDKDYIPLMQEREDEYQEEMRKKMEAFRKEHAARVIQGAWRTVLANRNEKKKLKKKLKKIQKEQARQQKIADAKEKRDRKTAVKAVKQRRK